MALRFEDTITPLTPERFLSENWNTKFFYSKGPKNRFKHLLPWNILNTILTDHRIDSSRIRIVKDMQGLPPEEYIYTPVSANRRAAAPRLMANKINEQLNQGAYLIFDGIDELYEPVRDLAKQFEGLLHEKVHVNAYISFGSSYAFDPHWDPHDVFVLQIHGKKKWSVFGETVKHPVSRGLGPKEPVTGAPKTKPVWSQYLQEGDMLYLPRGWWHYAVPKGPSLHLTFGVPNRTGIDLFNWMANKLYEDAFFRKGIPFAKGKKAMDSYEKRIAKKINLLFKRNHFAAGYMQSYNEAALPRQHFSFPYSITGTDELSDNVKLKLAISRNITLKTDKKQDTFSFKTLDNEWTFANVCLPFFKLIIAKRECTIRDAKKACKGIQANDFSVFIKELLKTGLVYTENI